MLAVGNEDQIAALDDVEALGKLGCFALTEKRAGVQSGLVVETSATFDAATNEFVLTSPNQGVYLCGNQPVCRVRDSERAVKI